MNAIEPASGKSYLTASSPVSSSLVIVLGRGGARSSMQRRRVLHRWKGSSAEIKV